MLLGGVSRADGESMAALHPEEYAPLFNGLVVDVSYWWSSTGGLCQPHEMSNMFSIHMSGRHLVSGTSIFRS